MGRQGYPLRALWRAYIASFVLNLPHTNALIRRLEEDQDLRELCGFRRLPHRTTFNRFIQRLSHHVDLVEAVFPNLTSQVRDLLLDLGGEVAVDSTTVRSHCNPNRKHISDPEASWTAKTKAGAKNGGKDWSFGYKVHMVADVTSGLLLAQVVTTAKRSDSPELPGVIDHAKSLYSWFSPRAVIADKGYDSATNHEFLYEKRILPIILVRHRKKDANNVYTHEGIPTCLGQVPIEYVRSDQQGKRLYRCRPQAVTWPELCEAGSTTVTPRSGKTLPKTSGSLA